jgi:hypothetical protein
MRYRHLASCLGALALTIGCSSASIAAPVGQLHAPASTPSIGMGDTFKYEGREVTPRYAAEQALACNQEISGTTCFDSQSEALAAKGVAPEANAARAHGSRKTLRARAALVCSANDGRPLVLWEHGEYGGWNVNMFTRQWWGDLEPYVYDNAASSYRMGGHSGHISDGINGQSYWYPGPTGICNEGPHMGAYNWTDRATSRHRN